MAKRPRINPDDLDRRTVTDLRQYKKAKEQAKRREAAKPPKPPSGSFLGSNPRAGLILALLAAAVVAFYVLPRFL